MLRKIQDLLDKHGELTFQQVCHELNCFSLMEVVECQTYCEQFARIGECNITNSTILYPNPVGFQAHRRTELQEW